LTFPDKLSKYNLAVQIKKQDTVTVAKAFVEEIVLKFAILKAVLADHGTPLLCLIQTTTLPRDSPHTNCCLVGTPK
jgi:hypothetical protein